MIERPEFLGSKHTSKLQWAILLVLAVSDSICRILIQNVYFKFFLAIWHMMASLNSQHGRKFPKWCLWDFRNEFLDSLTNCRFLFRMNFSRRISRTLLGFLCCILLCDVVHSRCWISEKLNYYSRGSSSVKTFNNCCSSIIFSIRFRLTLFRVYTLYMHLAYPNKHY